MRADLMGPQGAVIGQFGNKSMCIYVRSCNRQMDCLFKDCRSSPPFFFFFYCSLQILQHVSEFMKQKKAYTGSERRIGKQEVFY